MKGLLFIAALFLYGCPPEESCQKVLDCAEDREQLCYPSTNGCGQDCHYYVFETCVEICKPAHWPDEVL